MKHTPYEMNQEIGSAIRHENRAGGTKLTLSGTAWGVGLAGRGGHPSGWVGCASYEMNQGQISTMT